MTAILDAEVSSPSRTQATRRFLIARAATHESNSVDTSERRRIPAWSWARLGRRKTSCDVDASSGVTAAGNRWGGGVPTEMLLPGDPQVWCELLVRPWEEDLTVTDSRIGRSWAVVKRLRPVDRERADGAKAAMRADLRRLAVAGAEYPARTMGQS